MLTVLDTAEAERNTQQNNKDNQGLFAAPVNFAYNDTRRGIRKVSLLVKCRYTRSLIVCNYSSIGLCCGHGNSVVISAVVISEVDCISSFMLLQSSGMLLPDDCESMKLVVAAKKP